MLLADFDSGHVATVIVLDIHRHAGADFRYTRKTEIVTDEDGIHSIPLGVGVLEAGMEGGTLHRLASFPAYIIDSGNA